MQGSFLFKQSPVVMQQADFKFKVTVNEETKRVQVPANNCSRAAVIAAVQQVFQAIPLNGKALKYVDDEGDLITCDTDEEFSDFFASAKKHIKLEDKAATVKEKMAKQIVKRIQNFNKILESNDQDSIKSLALIVDALRSGANQVGATVWDQIVDGSFVAPAIASQKQHVLEVDVAKGSVSLKKPAEPAAAQKNPLDDTWTYVEVQNQLPEQKPQQLPPQQQPQQPQLVQQQPPFVQQPNPFNQAVPQQYPFPQPVPLYSSFQGAQVSPSPVPFQIYQQQQPQQLFSAQPLTASGFQQIPPQQIQAFYQQPQQQQAAQQQPPRPQLQPQVVPPQAQQAQASSPYPNAVTQLREMGIKITPQIHALVVKHKGNIPQIIHEICNK